MRGGIGFPVSGAVCTTEIVSYQYYYITNPIIISDSNHHRLKRTKCQCVIYPPEVQASKKLNPSLKWNKTKHLKFFRVFQSWLKMHSAARGNKKRRQHYSHFLNIPEVCIITFNFKI